jgi:biopolymer transport protein ExbD
VKFKRRIKLQHGIEQINLVPMVDVIFQLLIFFMLTSSFTFPSSIPVKLPKAVTSDVIKEQNLTITISSEDVVYLQDQVITLKELSEFLSREAQASEHRPILIKADRRASMGRIVDVWDLCRELGLEQIHIATNRN